MNNKRALEPELKAMLLNHLRNRKSLSCSDTIMNEFTVGDFSRRVDLALIRDCELIGFEVKSEADSLYRLEGQTQKYLEYFDKVVIVAASKHIPSILSLVPNNVGVWEVLGDRIVIRRRGIKKRISKKLSFIEMMRVSE